MSYRPISRPGTRWTLAFAFAALAATTGWTVVAWRTSHRAAAPAADAGRTMPDFRLPTADGRDLAARDLAGHVVLYEFWATWCTPCHAQVEILRELYPAQKAKGAEFVGIATGEPADVVREYLAKHPSPYPSVIDSEEDLGTKLDVLGLPTLVVVDGQGRIVWRNTGLTDAGTLERVLADARVPRG